MHGRGACMAGGMHGNGVYTWQGDMHGRGCVHGWGGGGVWQERQPLQWMVCILLECILVNFNINQE